MQRHYVSRINASLLLKYLQVTRQVTVNELCQIMDISKSQYSRLQTGKSQLTFKNSLIIEDYFKLKLSRIHQGMISETPTVNCFDLPDLYSHNQFTKDMAIFYFWMLRNFLGEDIFLDFMKYEGLPPEYFINTQNSINVRFPLRALEELITRKIITPHNLEMFAKAFCQLLHIPCGSHPTSMFNLINSVEKFEINHKYKIEDLNSKSFTFSFIPGEHIEKKIYFSPILGNITAQWVKSISSVVSGREATIVEDIFHGGGKCVISIPS